ncbi:MAG: hypothetical protein ACXWC9_01175 [Pseudobdellovibrionaceae bacterium]
MAKHAANPRRQANDIQVDGGRTPLEDAKISGYTDSKGRAISRAIKDDTESSVGGYTNITSGRSAAIPHRPKNEK